MAKNKQFFFLKETNKNHLRSLLMAAEKRIRKANSSCNGIVCAICKWCFSIWLIPFPFANGKLKYVAHFQRHAFQLFLFLLFTNSYHRRWFFPSISLLLHIYFVYWVNVSNIDVCLWADHPFSYWYFSIY